MKGKRAIITPENERDIWTWAVDAFRSMERTKLAAKIQSEFIWKGPAPEIEVLEKKISSYRNKVGGPEDETWSTASLDKYPIPPETLPSVLKVWVRMHEDYLKPFTIRQAKWVARLCFVVKDIDELCMMSFLRSVDEIRSEVIGNKVKPNSSESDLTLYSLLTREVINPSRRSKILDPRLIEASSGKSIINTIQATEAFNRCKLLKLGRDGRFVIMPGVEKTEALNELKRELAKADIELGDKVEKTPKLILGEKNVNYKPVVWKGEKTDARPNNQKK